MTVEITAINRWVVGETITQIELATKRNVIAIRGCLFDNKLFLAVDFDRQLDRFPAIELIVNTNARRIVWAGKKMVLEI